MKRNFRPLLVVVGSLALVASVAAVLVGLAWYKYQSIATAAAQGPPPEMPEAITLATSELIAFRASATAIGTIRAPRSITLRNEVPGQVIEVGVQAGQTVTAGQVLLVLDHSVEDAMLHSAQARRQMAKSMLDRTQRVAKENAASGNEIDTAEAEMAQSDAEVARLQAIINKKTLTAPFHAKAGLLNTHVGQFLSEGSEITSLQGIDDYVEIDFMMPQSVADAVKINQEVTLLVEPEPLTAILIALDSIADRSTRNLLGRARLQAPPDYLQPGDAVKVNIEYGPEVTGVAVPAKAIRRAPTGAFVYVVAPDASSSLRAQSRRIVPGQSIDDSVVIFGGIDAGERVAVDGSFKLRDGVLVMDQPPAIGLSEDDNLTKTEVSSSAF